METVEFIDLTGELWEDPRGFSFYPLKGRAEDPAKLPDAFHLVSIAPGQVRGNHLHPGRWEWLYSFHGTGIFRWKAQSGELLERTISGHRFLIRIPPGVAHSLRNLGPDPIYLLAWREGEADTDDTVPHPLG